MKRALPLLSLILLLSALALGAETKAEEEARKRAERTVIVKADSARLLDKTGSGAKALATLDKFTPVEVLETSGSHKKVKTQAGRTGYVAASDLAARAFVSISGSYANLRSGPGPNDPARFRLPSKYPLLVIDVQGARVQVADYEGDTGWVHKNLLSEENYVIVRLDRINLREGPSTDHPLRFTAQRNVLLKVLEEKDGWLLAQAADGDKAWCSAKIVWGYLPEVPPKKK